MEKEKIPRIWFANSRYHNLFQIPDGDFIQIFRLDKIGAFQCK